MIETAIEAHIREKVAEAWPDITADQCNVLIRGGEMGQSRNKSRACIGSETLNVELMVHTVERPDRLPLIRQLQYGEFIIDGTKIEQQYVRHRYFDRLKTAGVKRTVFYLRYTYDIFEGE